MKLDGENIIFCHRTSKWKRILGVCRGGLRGGRFDVIAVHEVEARILRNVLPHRVRHRLVYLIPAHVRYFEPLLNVGHVFQNLKKRGVLIKNLDGTHPLLKNCLRVTVGKPDENALFLAALEGSLA